MTLQRFSALLDAYGADARRWPSAERAAAVAFARDSAAASALLAEAAALDAMLDTDVVAAASPQAHRALLAALPQRRGGRWDELLALLGGWRIAAPSMAMALLAGINLGATTGLGSPDDRGGGAAEARVDGGVLGSGPGFAETLFLGLNGRPR